MKSAEDLKNNLLESKKNMKIGAAMTAAGTLLDLGIANLQIHDLTVLSTMSTLVVVPAMIVAINANNYIKTRHKIDKEKQKVLKKQTNSVL